MSEPPSKRLKQSSILRAFASSRTKTASNIFTDIFNDKYVVHDVAKDGNCLFSALAAGLRLPHTAESVRADVAQYASSHMEEINQVPFDEFSHLKQVHTDTVHSAVSQSKLASDNLEYLHQMNESGHWGDGIMIAAAARLYQRDILVVMDKDHKCTDVHFTPDELITPQPLCIGYTVSANHYVFLEAKVAELSESAEDASTITSDIIDEPQPGQNEPDNSWPPCWTKEQFVQKCTEYPWLVCAGGKLGCKVCQKVGTLKIEQSQGVKLSSEWVACSIEPFGNNQRDKLQALRKKIFDHKSTRAHLAAEKILASSARNSLQEATARHNKEVNETTCRVFRSAYKIAKKERPYSDLPADIELQQLNGIDVGRVLHSDHLCADIISHVATEMRRKLIADIIFNGRKLAILIDESTSVSCKTVLTVCMRAAVTGSGPLTFFLDMIELPRADARTIKNELLGCLAKFGFDSNYLHKHFICFAADGASTMLGAKSGVATLLVNDFPDLLVWHCSNHRLELAVGDTVKEVIGINNFQSFVDKLFTTYHASAKNRRELQSCAVQVECQVLSIGRIFDVRWVSSSERTIRAIWTNYAALHKHFVGASLDKERDSATRQKYLGLSKRLAAVGFIHNMGVMLDALIELGDLSRELQKRDMNLPRAHSLIDRQIRVLQSMAETPGKYTQEASRAIEKNEFKGITLTQNTKVDIQLHRGQFYRSLVANLRQRLLTTTASHVGTQEKSREVGVSKLRELLSAMSVLDKDQWPSVEEDPQYGETAIDVMCQKMGFDARPCILDFREYRQHPTTHRPTHFDTLQNAVDTYVVSTAECERSFSVMNDTLSPERNNLTVKHLSELVFIKSVCPPLSDFDPKDYVSSWLKKGRRSADETNCLKHVPKNLYNPYSALWKLL